MDYVIREWDECDDLRKERVTVRSQLHFSDEDTSVEISLSHRHPGRGTWTVYEGQVELPLDRVKFVRDVLTEILNQRGMG